MTKHRCVNAVLAIQVLKPCLMPYLLTEQTTTPFCYKIRGISHFSCRATDELCWHMPLFRVDFNEL